MYELTGLYTYPIKSCRGNAVSSLVLDSFGPEYDRRFMLVGSDLKHVTQRTDPLMAGIEVSFDGAHLQMSIKGEICRIAVSEFSDSLTVTVWSDEVDALGLSSATSRTRIDKMLSEYLGKIVRLVYMPPTTYRPVDPEFSGEAAQVSFADGFPILLCSEASLEDLNSRLDARVCMDRFRPNMVISGAPAYAESEWRRVRVGGVEFDLVKPCSRCSMITLDAQGAFNKEPLKTLANYRLNEFGACFGENLVHRGEGVLSLGMSLEVLK